MALQIRSRWRQVHLWTPQQSEVSPLYNSSLISSNPRYSLTSSYPRTTFCKHQLAPKESTFWVTLKSVRERFMNRDQSRELLITRQTICRPTCNSTHLISSLNISTHRILHAILNTITNRLEFQVGSQTKLRFSSTSAFLRNKKSYTSPRFSRALKLHGFNMLHCSSPAFT